MSEELRSCPFCGGNKFMEQYYNDDVRIRCKKCGLTADYYTKLEYAINGWNTRPIEDALRAENERLRAILKLLPLDYFDKPREELDAADFVDCSNSFIEAMDKARKALAPQIERE